jgi:hypothetical protein
VPPAKISGSTGKGADDGESSGHTGVVRGASSKSIGSAGTGGGKKKAVGPGKGGLVKSDKSIEKSAGASVGGKPSKGNKPQK